MHHRKLKWQSPFKSFQKQPSDNVLRKRRSENMQQICRRTAMLKCDFIEITLQYGCSPVNLLRLFRTCFLRTLTRLLLLLRFLSRYFPLFTLYMCLWNKEIKRNLSCLLRLFFKGTVMQIEKALINDRSRFSEVPWKFRIPTIVTLQ